MHRELPKNVTPKQPHKNHWKVISLLVLISAFFFSSLQAGCIFDPPNLNGWSCFVNDECLDNLVCRNKRCVPGCQNDSDCQGGTCQSGACSGSGDGGGGDGICIPKAEECNGKDDNCDGRIDEGLLCVGAGDTCDPKANQPVNCKEGLLCVTYYPDRPKICLEPCTKGQATSCADKRFQCLPTPGQQWACLQSGCNTQTDCVYNSLTTHECANIGGNDKFCLPEYPKTGSITFGNICAPSEGNHCDGSQNLGCWRQDEASQGFCTLRCQTDAECEKLSGGQSKCRVFSTNSRNIKVCSFPCDTGSCPQGMTCNAEKVCTVP